jgi:cysteinyl-tRNA synthetase
MYDCLARIAICPEGGEGKAVINTKDRERIESLKQRFEQAMDNDFNTAQALGLLFDAIKVLNKGVQALPPRPASEDIALLRQGGGTVRELAAILGLLQEDPGLYVQRKKQKRLAAIEISVADIEEMIRERTAARERKDWAAGDGIRDRLLAHGIELRDGASGTTWDIRLG